jgi:uncharacterized protein
LKLLLNSTKTMDPTAPFPTGTRTTRPLHSDRAALLIDGLRALPAARHRKEMAVSESLARSARADLALWGEKDQPSGPALFAFTGLVYKYIDAATLEPEAVKRAQKNLIILSGLYGLLRPLDRIQAYRLEMGAKWAPKPAKNMAIYWRETLTGSVNAKLKRGEPIINLAAQEYVKVLDIEALKSALISPVFKERRPDGTLKTAPVHAKMARGAMARFILSTGSEAPADLLQFGEMGWEADGEAPPAGPWLFTRPVRE